MQYIITYDLIGLFILAFLYILNFTIIRAPSRTVVLYRAFIIASFIAAFLDVFTIWSNYYTNTPLTLALNTILAVIHIASVGLVPAVYYLFVLNITHDQDVLPKGNLIFLWILYGYDFITIATSPFTHFVMYYNEAGEYCHGPGFLGTYIIIAILVIAGVIELAAHFRKISPKQFFLVLSYTVIDIACAVYQFMNPEILLIGFSSAISLLVIYFALKSPTELIDNNLGVLNRTAFKDFLFSRKNKGVMAIIHINNAESIKYMYGLDNGYSILRKVISMVMNEWRAKLGFYVFKNTYVLICKDEEDAHQKLEILKKHKTEPLIVNLDEYGKKKLPVTIESDAFLIKDAQLLHRLNEIESDKNPLDRVIDILQFLVESIKGTNEINVIDDTFIEYYKERVRIQKVVDEALAKERFEVFLQPIFDLKTKKFTGAESLIRLRDLDGKMISPALFVPEAEKNGKILQLGDISIKKTCEFIRDGNLQALGVEKVNINLSMVQCMQDNIVDHLIGLLDQYNIPREMIRFEITETITTTNPAKLKQVMQDLSDYGIEFALDDYGTGYSNTSRLLEFPFSEIKFDKSFVDSAMENARNSLPLKHLMSMVSDSNMIVLVEGVETKEMSEMIESFGGNLIQGFYYAKPLPMNDFVEFIKKHN